MNEAINEINPSIAVLISAFLPLVLALINRYNWPTEAKALVSLVLSCAIGFGLAWLSDVRSVEGIAATMAAVYALAQVAFMGVWRPTGVADGVERRTG